MNNSDLCEILRKCKGNMGLAAIKSGCSISALQKKVDKSPKLRKVATESSQTFLAAVNEVSLIRDRVLNATAFSSPAAQYQQLVNEYLLSSSNIIKKYKKISNGSYHSIYADAVYELLSSSPFINISHICTMFNCTDSTLLSWMSEYEEFENEYQKGRKESEVKARDILLRLSSLPTNSVNTSLIRLLLSSEYGIVDDKDSIDEEDTMAVPIPIKIVEIDASRKLSLEEN